MTWRVIHADVLAGLAQLPDASVQTVVTSPPYWGLRDYGTATWEGGDAACDHLMPPGPKPGAGRRDAERRQVDGFNGPVNVRLEEKPYPEVCGKCNAVRIDSQLGLEPTPEAYVEKLVGVFREIRRVLRPDGTAWLNLGDSYGGYHGNGSAEPVTRSTSGLDRDWYDADTENARPTFRPGVPKPKDLVGIPWRVAFALQADGWYLRSDVIWAKPNPMPESVTDRPTKAHEYMFLLTRSARYFYDADAVREASLEPERQRWDRIGGANGHEVRHSEGGMMGQVAGRNLRSVWNIATEPYPEAHFATFPKALVVPCVKAGTSEKGCCAECGAALVRVVEMGEVRSTGGSLTGARASNMGTVSPRGQVPASAFNTGTFAQHDHVTKGWAPSCTHHEADVVPCTVLDPFAGSGTVGVVALRYGRSFVGIELNPTYAEMARERIRNDAPLWNHAAEVV